MISRLKSAISGTSSMPFMRKIFFSRRRPFNNLARLLCVLASGIVLAGCAAQMAYRDGKDLVAQDKPEEALAKFQEALVRDPHNVEYRQAWLQTRERSIDAFLDQADRQAASGASDEARKLYQRVLKIDPANTKAQAGIKALDNEVREAVLLKEADAALHKKDIELARQKVDQVLAENPENPHALAIRQSIDDQAEKNTPEAQLAKAYKKPITIEFKDVALKQIFEVISRTSGLNFLFDKDVKTDQKTSIFLKNSSIESAVHFVLLTNQLEEQVLDGNTVLIYPNTSAKQKDYQEMAVRTFFLTSAEAKTVANTLKTIVKSHDIVVDEKLNMIMLRDTPDAIKLAEKLVALQDVPEPEVMLEVEVLEVQRTRLQDLGIQWPASLSVTPLPLGTQVSNSTTTGATGTTGTTTTSTASSASSSTLSLNDLLHQNKNSLGVTIGSATANANVQDSDAKLLTNPRIRVRNHEKAKILIGERVPNITSTATSTGFVSQSINYIDIGLTLNVEPTVYLDDEVGIKVGLEVSSIISQVTTTSGTSAYEIGTRTANTVLRLKNGETDVLAGLIDNQERTSGNKIPGLGDMPVLGRLFGATTDDDEKTEIVLSITPHLIRNIQRPSASDAYFPAGTESSLRTRPDSGGSGTVTPNTNTSTPQNQQQSPVGTNPNTPASSTDPNTNSGLNGLNANNGLASTPITSTGTGDVAVGGAVAATGVAELQWQGPTQAAVGSSFSVSLVMQSTQAVTSVPLTISYDTTKLRLTNVAEGPFLKQAGAATSFTSRQASTGTWSITDTTSSEVGASASAVLTTLTFTALAPASPTDIQVLNVAPVGVGGVSVSAVPPAALALTITN